MDIGKCMHGNGPECERCKAMDIPEVEEMEVTITELRAEVERLRGELKTANKQLRLVEACVENDDCADLPLVSRVANAVECIQTLINAHCSATARAEAAEGRAAGLYRALCDTVRASGGVASDGISDTFLIIGVPAEMAARKKAQEAAESTVAGLRRALEEARQFSRDAAYGASIHAADSAICDSARRAEDVCIAALAASPDEHARRIKSEALEEVSKELRTAIDHVMCCYNDSDIGGLQLALAKIAQLEKDSEECLKCSYANVAGKKVVYQRCADCDAEADRLEATNG